jgi:hypothetical protein
MAQPVAEVDDLRVSSSQHVNAFQIAIAKRLAFDNDLVTDACGTGTWNARDECHDFQTGLLGLRRLYQHPHLLSAALPVPDDEAGQTGSIAVEQHFPSVDGTGGQHGA